MTPQLPTEKELTENKVLLKKKRITPGNSDYTYGDKETEMK